MARVTARQAFRKAQERIKGKNGRPAKRTNKDILESHLRQQSDQSQQADTTGQPLFPRLEIKPTLKTTRATKNRKALDNNRKITDFYQVIKRDRENILKTPPTIRTRALAVSQISNDTMQTTASTTAQKWPKPLPSDPASEIILICDSEDEDDADSGARNVEHTKIMGIENSIIYDQTSNSELLLNLKLNSGCSSPSSELENFKDLTVAKKADDDIEVLDILPPIPLRDHPVFDLDGPSDNRTET